MSERKPKSSKSEALKRRQARAIAALIEHATMEKAARACGIGYSTIRRWQDTDPDFREALRLAQARLLDNVFAALTARAAAAVETLERNLSSGVHGVEVRAALGWLSLLNKRNEATRYQRMEAELERLHELLDEQEERRGVGL